MVALPDGRLAFGRTLPGRGAWLCRGSLACFDAAARRNAFGRALRTTVGSEAVASLRATLVNRARMSTELDRTELNGAEPMAPRVDHNSEHG